MSPALAPFCDKLLTATVSEVRDRGVLGYHQSSSVLPAGDIFLAVLCVVFGDKLDHDVSDELIDDVIADAHLFDLAKLREFQKNLLVKIFELLDLDLDLLGRHRVSLRDRDLPRGVLVKVREKQRRRLRRLQVPPRTVVAEPARPRLEVERTIDPVVFGEKSVSEIFCHY